MAKEVKSGTKKAAVKKTTAAKKPVTTRKTSVPKKVTKSREKQGTIAVVYMFLLILGVSLIFVSLALKMTNDISNATVLSCLGIALASLIVSAFIKKLND